MKLFKLRGGSKIKSRRNKGLMFRAKPANLPLSFPPNAQF
ncbi:hypothetical protein GEOBRER4_n2843 [Citrifermentans bremense]|uniref:Uncharacterized protein n=1 Tax=Citrifermentans bremense TaxID=60035 RepID=A0A7R7FTC5_9BACT|nr:hypothetical protein GEOBRER4_n2843 [Citrifermentans bremense]